MTLPSREGHVFELSTWDSQMKRMDWTPKYNTGDVLKIEQVG
jgi:hypothetical protein